MSKMALITFEKLLQIIETVLKVLLKLIDTIQGDEPSE